MPESNGLEQRFSRVEDQIGEVQGQLGQVVASVGKLEVGIATTNETVRSLAQSVQQVSDRQNERRETNWFGLVTACIGVISILGAFIMLHVSPIREQVSDHHRRLEVVTERAIQQAADAARQAETLRWLEKAHDRKQASP